MTSSSLSELVEQMVSGLHNLLSDAEDAETAISIYKQTNWIIYQLEGVKDQALALAEQDLQRRELEALKTAIGSAGWTEPRTRQLDEKTWRLAMAEDPRLMEIQQAFDQAKTILERVQEPFMESPEPRFYIR
ncbi:MAG: hypothetical protein JXA74_00940 [Anaerolineae bacterium]|nr:hypothetical protein [Anaerolineae bacterium]